jgi:MFS family permease
MAPLSLWLIDRYKDPYVAFLAQTMFGICLSIFGGPMTAWMVESFPPEARLTSMSIGYNIAQCIMGGTSPVISTSLVAVGSVAPGFFITACGLLAAVGIYISDISEPDRIKIEKVYGKGGGCGNADEVDTRGLLKEGYESEEEERKGGKQGGDADKIVIVDI